MRGDRGSYRSQAKENADDLLAQKKELDAQKEKKMKETKEHELAMRAKASNVGNIVGKSVPISLTEVCRHGCFL